MNGRWVRAEGLIKGLDEAYRATVPGGRYPPVALSVDVDPQQVDVNVHPAKQLVRFSDEHAARQAVAEAVRRAIQGDSYVEPDSDHRTQDASGLVKPPETDEQQGGEANAPSATRPEKTPQRSADDRAPPVERHADGRKEPSAAERLFGSSAPVHADSPRVPDLTKQRMRLKEAAAPLSEARDGHVERGELP